MDIQYLPGVGPRRAMMLKNELEISTVDELIHFYPFRYIDRSTVQRIAEVSPDLAFVQIMAEVKRVTLYGPDSNVLNTVQGPVRFNTVKRMSVIVSDESGEMEMVFFKGIKWNYEKLKPGSIFIFFGKPQSFNGRINIVHP